MRTYHRFKPCRRGHSGDFLYHSGHCVDCKNFVRFRNAQVRPLLLSRGNFDLVRIVNFPVSTIPQLRSFVEGLGYGAAPDNDASIWFHALTPQTGTHTTVTLRAYYPFVNSIHEYSTYLQTLDPCVLKSRTWIGG